MRSAIIEYAGLFWDVDYDYSPPVPGRQYLRNGDPGYPDDPEEIELLAVYTGEGDDDLLEFLSPATIEGLEDGISALESSNRDIEGPL
jgi:hypothetical protein